MGAKLRDVRLWTPELAWREREDGSSVVWREDPLPRYPDRITERALHWAREAPDRVWMAERGADGNWRCVNYAELLDTIRRLGQALIGLGVSVERPVLILSGNSLAHASLALAAQHVGIPSAAISPAYSLVSSDHAKLRTIVAQITPGLVFAERGRPFAPAIGAAIAPDVPVVSVSEPVSGPAAIGWETLLVTEPTRDVEARHAAIRPDDPAKFLFTSGTTGSPKAVVQTHRMLCANQAMIADCFAFMGDEPPVFVDWAPWNHTASGNKVFNMTLHHGGTYYVDAGRPAPGAIEETLRNLREISPTWYFNVPAGYEMLVAAMEGDAALRQRFFARVKMLMYAGAGLAAHTWRRLEELAEATVGERILLTTGLGSTETAPFSLYCTEPQAGPGNVGIPAQGVTMKLVPEGDRLECRLKGPNITPGYWRSPELTAAAFDAEGFYRIGDALRPAVPGDPRRGFFFDGRIAENFKLATGTWVAVGPLRAALVDAMGGLVRDAVIAGENQPELGALLLPFGPELRKLVAEDVAAGEPEDEASLLAHPAVRSEIARRLAAHAAAASGSASRVTRALLLAEPLSFDAGEVTDKGSINQRAVLRRRADQVDRLFSGDPQVIRAAPV